METAAIGYRIVDFLKKYPPFAAIEEADLLALTSDGRVRFHEANDYILWQGEPHKLHVFVIQQGTVSLWDDDGERLTLRDVRGAGDMLGIERFNGARSCLQSAKAESDVLLYGFSESDFDALLHKYPHAREYVAAYSGVNVRQLAEQDRDSRSLYLNDVVGRRPLVSCHPGQPISEVAQRLLDAGSRAVVVRDVDHRGLDVVTVDRIVAWVARGGGDAGRPVSDLPHQPPTTVRTDASVTDGVLAMAAASVGAIALTTDGTPDGQLVGVATAHDLAPVFGDQPAWMLADIATAADTAQLRDLNQRVRAFVLRSLDDATSVDWLVRFTHLADAAIVGRLIRLTGQQTGPACWCFAGSAGRAESLTAIAPRVAVIAENERDLRSALAVYERVMDVLEPCGYLPRENPFERAFSVASLAEWQQRYRRWIADPVMTEMYRARPLFDLRAVHGPRAPWEQLASTVADAVDSDFLRVLANDCLASLPPLAIFQDAVVEDSGSQSAVFRLEHSALRPLVDVGRLFGVASRSVLGQSTIERFAVARTLMPEHESIFREARDAFRVVLWMQGRVGVSQGSGGFELPPTALSRYDRHLLKGCFRSILRLIEFAADLTWLETL